MNIEKMIQDITSNLATDTAKKVDKDASYKGRCGDSDMYVEVEIDSNKKIKNIIYSKGLKEFKEEDLKGEDQSLFWQCLTDCLIGANADAISKVHNEVDNVNTKDIINQVENMTKSFGGMNGIEGLLKNLNGPGFDALLKNMMPNAGNSFGKKFKGKK